QPAVVVQEARTGKWKFKADLLAAMKKTNYLQAQFAQDGLGRELNLDRLVSMEPNFTADKFAAALTKARLHTLLWGVVNEGNKNAAAWSKGGRWPLPADVLQQGAKLTGYGDNCTRDGWGREFRLVKWAAGTKNATGQPIFDEAGLVSAGPD